MRAVNGTFNLEPTRTGARITMTSDDGQRFSVTTDRTRSQVEHLIRDLCLVAGLPEPWGRR